MADLSGSTVGQYHIHQMIGHGGMADVYLADQTSIGRQVAIKVLPAHFLQDRTFLQRFMQEVKVIAGLQHPHILPVYDFGEYDGMPYIVMAYLTGGSLADRIHQEGSLPVSEVARFVQQIASGLEYAHRKGIIHRDFKPSNVLLDEQGNGYLADFGIAKITESTAQLTGSGVVGTPAYMAPEMSQRGGVSTLVDVYALGITLYQMLAGRLPYEADTPMGVLMAHVTQPIPDVREARPDLPDAVQTVIERAMAKDPMFRHQSPKDVADDLAAALADQPISLPEDPAKPGQVTLVEGEVEWYDEAATQPEFDERQPTTPEVVAQVEKAPRKQTRWLIPAIGGLVVLGALAAAGVFLLSGQYPQTTSGAPSSMANPSPTQLQTVPTVTHTPLPPTSVPATSTPMPTAARIDAMPPECADARACVVIAPGDPIKIGFAGPMTGDFANYGIDVSRGSNLAIEDAGALGDHAFELVIEDDGGSPDGGDQVANQFVSAGDIAAVVGHVFSGASNAAIPVYQNALIPMMSPSSTGPTLTTRGSSVFNRVAFSDLDQGRTAAEFIYRDKSIANMAIIHDGSSYGQGLADAARTAYIALGGNVTVFQAITPGLNDYSSVLRSIAGNPPGAIFFGGYESEAAALVNGLSAAGLTDVVFVSGDGSISQGYLNMAGSNAEGTYATSVSIPADSTAKTAFDRRYQDSYGDDPGVLSNYSWYGYDAAAVIIDAVKRSAGETPDGTLYIPRTALVAAVRSTSQFGGITGIITCSEVGECASPTALEIYVVQNGSFVPVH